jgi:hypothetical protein
LVTEATRQSLVQSRNLIDVLREMPDAIRHLGLEGLRDLEVPEKYLGVAEQFRNNLVSVK